MKKENHNAKLLSAFRQLEFGKKKSPNPGRAKHKTVEAGPSVPRSDSRGKGSSFIFIDFDDPTVQDALYLGCGETE